MKLAARSTSSSYTAGNKEVREGTKFENKHWGTHRAFKREQFSQCDGSSKTTVKPNRKTEYIQITVWEKKPKRHEKKRQWGGGKLISPGMVN